VIIFVYLLFVVIHRCGKCDVKCVKFCCLVLQYCEQFTIPTASNQEVFAENVFTYMPNIDHLCKPKFYDFINKSSRPLSDPCLETDESSMCITSYHVSSISFSSFHLLQGLLNGLSSNEV
jgi:hypothetical protein